jgi:large subunit ribosomal protein L15
MSTFKLNALRPRHGIDKKALGRGIGSGCGKTSSYGHKGAKARSGRGAASWFEGGQMPLYRRLPKRGFRSKFDRSNVACVNIERLMDMCDMGQVKANDKVTVSELIANGVVRAGTESVRLLAKGKISVPLHVVVNYATKNAVAAIEEAGGKVEII